MYEALDSRKNTVEKKVFLLLITKERFKIQIWSNVKSNRMGAKSEEMKEAKQKALLIHVEKRRSGWLSFLWIKLLW
jgi:hypothetical protein